MINLLGYFLRRALRNMRQSPLLCLAAVTTLAVSLAIVALFAIVVVNVGQFTARWSEEVQVVVYLDELPPQAEMERRIRALRDLPEVEGVEFVDRSQALERFRQRLGAHAELLDGMGAEILPASLEISLHSGQRHQQGVNAVIEHLQAAGMRDLRYGHEWLQRFEALLGFLRLLGLLLGGFLVAAALFIVSNTIRLTLYARRDELEIMALVGATPGFIKTPFVIEGALQGLAGALLALLGTWLLHQLAVREGLRSLLFSLGGGEVLFLPAKLILVLFAAGLLLGVMGSLAALRRFVRI